MNSFEPLIDIDTLASELNLGKDRLRKWEQRYGFPSPVRRDDGIRLYPADQVERLRKICRLLDAGGRAGRLLPLDDDALSACLQEHEGAFANPLLEGNTEALFDQLQAEIDRLFSQPAATDVVTWLNTQLAPLIDTIGHAWSAGKLMIWQEHLLTEQLQRGLCQRLREHSVSTPDAPRILLCTLPGEAHRLGILMAELVLRSSGAQTYSLGSEVPLDQIAAAADALQVDRLALSFSARQKRNVLINALQELRATGVNCGIWIGGAGASHLRRLPDNVLAIRQLTDLHTELRRLSRGCAVQSTQKNQSPPD